MRTATPELNYPEPIHFYVREDSANYDAPLINFVDHLLQHAIAKHASDIHIEPYEDSCRIRYRQQGILYEITKINLAVAARLVTRIKVMAQLNISERRLPQDGHFQFTDNKTPIDFRVNTCPTLFGEKIVLRILDVRHLNFAMLELGMLPEQLQLFLTKLSEPQGLILVTGPTGSGKTITLYSALNYLNNTTKNISSAEDPVEMRLPGINQINVHAKIGLDFATTLRAFLRQDPDVIMVGEIRDLETAQTAIHAAQTGHLVLSTLHTNNAVETLTRFHAMGIPCYDACNAITLIIAQRLIRTLCQHCKKFDKTTNAYKARGCEQCLEGYSGRTGIYETLPIVADLTHKMSNDTRQLADYLQQTGFLNLPSAAMTLVANGKTSLEEVDRVLRHAK